jgi:asparagine synthase (glutamine-hydrolysing)
MCGLVTIVPAEGQSVSRRVLEELTGTLIHRGPDDAGYAWVTTSDGTCRSWTSHPPDTDSMSGILFGHRRLSILDLSDAAHQPLIGTRSGFVLSYNGEIYNFVELRDQLAGQQTTFTSSGDTEVVLAAYERWGIEALNRFNGMWAFTIWDGRAKKLIAARDRFGVKPLYYTVVDGTWVFASEIKTLLAYPGARREADGKNVKEFLTRCLVDHTEETMFSGIRAIPPGGYLELQGGRATHHRYWRPPAYNSHRKRPDHELVAEFRALLAESVRLRMRSDVPVGTMLSGGLDSTSITALIDAQRATGAQRFGVEGWRSFHHTFTACWPDSAGLNEQADVRLLCDELHLSSVQLNPTAEMIRDILPRVTYHLDQPFESPVAAVQYLLMAETRKIGVKVVLNGHGSDEILAGYPEPFVPAFLSQLLLRGQLRRFCREWHAFRSQGQWSATKLMPDLLRGLTPASLRLHLLDVFRARAERRLAMFPRSNTQSHHDAVASETFDRLPMFEGLVWTFFSERTLPQWLRMEDRMSMAHSIESRLPFLDYRLVELSFQLPPTIKLRNGYTKYILREAMKDILPSSIALQRRKQRFATPFQHWFRGPWRCMVEDLLLCGNPKIESFMDVTQLRDRLKNYLAGKSFGTDLAILWRVLHTELWLRTFT